jgi:hypothetical protein
MLLFLLLILYRSIFLTASSLLNTNKSHEHTHLYNNHLAYLCENKQKRKRFLYTSFPTHTNDDALFTVHSNDQNSLRMG